MLNDLILIEKRKVVECENGFEESIWENNLSCWACREKTVTTEVYIGMSYRTKVESIYKIRNTLNTKRIDTNEHRILHKGKTYNIKSIIEDGSKGEFLKIQCEMVS